MRICFIADARSPIAKNWIGYFAQKRGHEIHVISTYPCSPESYPNSVIREVTSRVSRRAGDLSSGAVGPRQSPGLAARMTAVARTGRLSGVTFTIQHWLERSEVGKRSAAMYALMRQIAPDLVHAMRLPFEGIIAALADPPAPFLISIWGNDLTLFARRFPLTSRLTRQALQRTDALHCDCNRDLALATQFGFNPGKPSIVVPGSGGVQLDMFAGTQAVGELRHRFGIPEDAPLVCNPRGFRGYVRNDTFFRSAALTVKVRPDVMFAAVGMEGHPVAQQWVSSLGIQSNVKLLPTLSRAEMAMLLQTSQVMVSPSEHDGTPNTLLESMAAGGFPICGNIESVREWVTDGVNGTLLPASDAEGFARAILSAIADPSMRALVARQNRQIILERAEYDSSMQRAQNFYELLSIKSQTHTLMRTSRTTA